MRLAIIADDLTGALDAAAPFAGRGLSVRVALSPELAARAVAEGADIVAISTQSRDGSEAQARAAVRTTLAALPRGLRILKKIDSRLKGHLQAEIAALEPVRMLVAPAIPDFGRVTRSGAVTGFGVATPIPVAARLGSLAERADIPDVATATEMQAALTDTPDDALLVGARGLAEALAIAMTDRAEATPIHPRAERALIVVGSQDPITTAQAERVAATGQILRLLAPLGDLDAAATDAAAPYLLVQATPATPGRDPDQVAQALAASIHPALTRGRDAIVLTGGATAEAALTRMGIGLLDLRGECLPGLPVADALTDAGVTRIIAKSGGFGDENTLVTLMSMFRGGN